VVVFDKQRNQFVGAVDALEVLAASSLNFFDNREYNQDSLSQYFTKWRFDCANVRDLLAKSAARCQRIAIFESNQTLQDVLVVLGDRDHRVLVKRDSKYYPLSHIEILKYFNEHNAMLPHISVQELGLDLNAHVPSIRTEDPAAKGFYLMHKSTQLSAVAVVDNQGKLVDALSVSDLRGLDPSNLHTVKQPTQQFHEHCKPHALVTAVAGTLLTDLVPRMLSTKAHRVWVVTSGQPIGVIEITHIIHSVLNATY